MFQKLKIAEALSFTAVRGKRFAAATSTVNDATAVAALTTIAILLEPVTHIQAFLLRITHKNATLNEMPAIMDLWWPPTSVVVHAQQYFVAASKVNLKCKSIIQWLSNTM